METHQVTSVPPTSSAPPGVMATLAAVDIVVLVVYFLLILAVGFWVGTEGERLLLQGLLSLKRKEKKEKSC